MGSLAGLARVDQARQGNHLTITNDGFKARSTL